MNSDCLLGIIFYFGSEIKFSLLLDDDPYFGSSPLLSCAFHYLLQSSSGKYWQVNVYSNIRWCGYHLQHTHILRCCWLCMYYSNILPVGLFLHYWWLVGRNVDPVNWLYCLATAKFKCGSICSTTWCHHHGLTCCNKCLNAALWLRRLNSGT